MKASTDGEVIGLAARTAVPTPEQLADYLDLTREEIERLVLYLLVQDALGERLGALPDAVRIHALGQGKSA
jgi:hypothetical protein